MTRYGFVSTYPPTLCGLATFTSALAADLVTTADSGAVIRSVEVRQPSTRDVDGQLIAGDEASVQAAANALNDCDVVIVQHEYGVYGGADGDEILTLLAALTVPSIVVLHTVLVAPTRHQREVLEAVATAAEAVVIMTATARDRLAAGYTVDMSKVSIIPHGVPIAGVSYLPTFRSGQPTVLTWGLMGPGKGIEWGIEAMALMADLDPAPRYLVAGQTHPKVLAYEGEAYRRRLQQRVTELNLSSTVTFDSQYRNAAALADLINTADLVLLPYDSSDQVTSGVLIEAIAAGKPVVATRFPHAVELLSDGAGMLVEHKDPIAIAAAVRELLTHRSLANKMAAAAAAAVPDVQWPTVAARYRELANRLIQDRMAA